MLNIISSNIIFKVKICSLVFYLFEMCSARLLFVNTQLCSSTHSCIPKPLPSCPAARNHCSTQHLWGQLLRCLHTSEAQCLSDYNWLSTQCDDLQAQLRCPLDRTSCSYGWAAFHGVYVSCSFHLLTSRWTLWLCQCLGATVILEVQASLEHMDSFLFLEWVCWDIQWF